VRHSFFGFLPWGYSFLAYKANLMWTQGSDSLYPASAWVPACSDAPRRDKRRAMICNLRL